MNELMDGSDKKLVISKLQQIESLVEDIRQIISRITILSTLPVIAEEAKKCVLEMDPAIFLRQFPKSQFTARASNFCSKNGIGTVDVLIRMSTKVDLLRTRHVGRKTVAYIEECLRPFGLWLGMK